ERTDIYAVGTMLYELLSGHTPFSGDSYQIVMTQHLRGALPRIDQEVAGGSPQLPAVGTRRLQRGPPDRYPSVRALIYDLPHLDKTDLSVLETGTGAATAVPFWRSSTFRTVVISLLVLVAIILLALAAQGLAPK